MLGLGLGLTSVLMGGGSAWSPSTLFKNGEQGWLMDLSLASLFQDAAGTVPVTAPGQPVGLVKDASGNGRDAFQSTALNRPIYQVDGSGRPYLSFNGTNQWMQTSTFDWGSDEVTACVGLRKLDDAGSTKVALEFSHGVPENEGSFVLFAPTFGGGNYNWGSKGTSPPSGAEANAAGYAAPVSSVVTGEGAISGDLARIRVDGAIKATSASDQGTGNYLSYPLFIGSRAGTSRYCLGNIYSLFGINRLLSPDELSNLEKWTAKKTGVELAA